MDPGEKFPWKKLERNSIGNWYKHKRIKVKRLDKKKIKKYFLKIYLKLVIVILTKLRSQKTT